MPLGKLSVCWFDGHVETVTWEGCKLVSKKCISRANCSWQLRFRMASRPCEHWPKFQFEPFLMALSSGNENAPQTAFCAKSSKLICMREIRVQMFLQLFPVLLVKMAVAALDLLASLWPISVVTTGWLTEIGAVEINYCLFATLLHCSFWMFFSVK